MKFWIGVASKDHVLRGIDGGFCQLCHGSAQPLKRMSVGDWLIYYSSKATFGEAKPARQFTAIGEIVGAEIYDVEMAPGFKPQRREVLFLSARCVDIRPMLDQLAFVRDKTHWGSAFRFGHLEIPRADFELIATKMVGVDPTVAIDSCRETRVPRAASA